MLQNDRIRLVVFDWAGTTVDHGCRAPVIPFIQVFAERFVAITSDEARGPMGLSKKDHLRALLKMPGVALRWRERHGGDATEKDINDLYERFMSLQLKSIDDHVDLVPGLLDCVAVLRQKGIAIGATTGYFREAAERVYRRAAEQGYGPDACLCAEDVPAGRPAPWMIFRIMERLNISPPSAVVKVGDTVPDIEEGLAAGVWSTGVVQSSSEVGCTTKEWESLSAVERLQRSENCREKLLAAKAHAVMDTLAELPAVIDELNAAMAKGEGRGVRS